MYSSIRQFCAALLPVSAVLSLVCGPSPSAAYAECQERVAQDRKAKQKSADERAETSAGDERSEPPCPEPTEDQSSFSCFVTPTAAKPTEAKKAGGPEALIGGSPCVVAARGPSEPSRLNPIDAPPPLHSPVYRANAPPCR